MPLDQSHAHSSASIMRADDVHNPIDPNGGSPTAAQVSFNNDVAGLPGDPVDVQGAIEGVAAEAGGGGDSVPVADALTASVDTTTYDNPFYVPGTTSEKLRTLVLSEYDVGVAIAKEGDAFPRFLYTPEDSAIYLGDGTFDPYGTIGALLAFVSASAALYGPAGASVVIEPDGSIFLNVNAGSFDGGFLNIGDVNLVNRSKGLVTAYRGIQPGAGGVTAPAITSGAGAPTIGGEVGDLFIRGDGADNNEVIYRCTVAGTAGLATWVALPLGAP